MTPIDYAKTLEQADLPTPGVTTNNNPVTTAAALAAIRAASTSPKKI